MSGTFLFEVAQFIHFLWPIFIAATLVYSLQGRGKLKTMLRRIRRDLLFTWSLLFGTWLLTWFAPGPNVAILPEPHNTVIFLVGFILLALLEYVPRLKNGVWVRVDLYRAKALADLKQMHPTHFEELVAETYRTLGYKTQHIGQSGDHGVDVLLRTSKGERWVVQCKRYRDSVGESVVRELYGTMHAEQAQRAILVTTADISTPAEIWARGKPIDLVDGPAFLDLLEKARQRRTGSLFDRLARWLAGPDAPPPGLAGAANQTANGHASTSPAYSPRRAEINGRAPIRLASSPDMVVRTQPVRTRVAETSPAPAAAAGDRSAARTAPLAATPARANGRNVEHNLYEQAGPRCPACGASMVPRPARPGDRPGRTFYRCSSYPTCRAVVEAP